MTVTINRWALAPVFELVTAANAVRLIESTTLKHFEISAQFQRTESLDGFRYLHLQLGSTDDVPKPNWSFQERFLELLPAS